MRIKGLSAENFRTLKNFQISFVADYCTISGKNNAGKTAVVRIIEHFLADDLPLHYNEDREIRFPRDSTQWESKTISLSIDIGVHRDDDAELYFFINKFSPSPVAAETVAIRLESQIGDGTSRSSVHVDGSALDERSSAEVFKKFRGASNLIVHNSTRPRRRYYYSGDEMIEFIESQFSDEDNRKIADAERALQSKVRAAAKKHKAALGEYLGRLGENYSVELSPPDRGAVATVPLGVTLSDKSVEVPLTEWGTGTQNRTKALISIFGAAHARESTAAQDRVTAVVIIEEPESFLHPSAQAEFGKILKQLSSEAKVQIIATTHSPYMLNQNNPEANVLLERRLTRGQLRETQIVDTSGEKWMRPFSENLGVVPEEFDPLAEMFRRDASQVVLVEGEIDVDYFRHIRDKYPHLYQLDSSIEIVAYGGKDTLKNTALIKFVLAKFDKVFLTYDLDAHSECKVALERLGLKENIDFCGVGVNKSGQRCIEGLLPDAIKSVVFSENYEESMALQGDSSERKSAKESLKRKMLQKFKQTDIPDSDLREFASLLKKKVGNLASFVASNLRTVSNSGN